MKEGGADHGYVRADQIDLKQIDEQLERFNRVVTTKRGEDAENEEVDDAFGKKARAVGIGGGGGGGGGGFTRSLSLKGVAAAAAVVERRERDRRKEWEIDPAKLTVKSVIARGTFGTVHRGVYDGLDVAGGSTRPERPHLFSLNSLALTVI